MRVARFAGDDDPRFGLVGEEDGTAMIAVLKGDPLYAGFELTGQKVPVEDVRLVAPVIPRSKVVGIGRNYAAHASELGNDVPESPLVFLKPNTSVVGPGEPIVYPTQTHDMHYEGELAVVIGRICKDVAADDAAKVVFGYTVANDVTARDLQHSDGQWARAKGFDSFCPLGPWIETNLDPSALRISTTVASRGEDARTVQDGSTSDMIFSVADIIAHVSSFMTLLPGDVILTGTPEGVGPLQVGDTVSVTIEGLGILSNQVVPGHQEVPA